MVMKDYSKGKILFLLFLVIKDLFPRDTFVIFTSFTASTQDNVPIGGGFDPESHSSYGQSHGRVELKA